MIRFLLLLFVFLGMQFSAFAQYRRDLGKEMDRLDADVALVLRRSLDYMPIWSEDSETLYVNVLNKWFAMEATRASLVETEIRGRRGGWNQTELLEPVMQEIIDGFDLDNYMSTVRGDTLDNIEASLDFQGFSSILTIKVDGKEFYRQQSGGEEYLFPKISPDKKYVAFITVMNGLMIVKLPDNKTKTSKSEKLVNEGIRYMNTNDCDMALKKFDLALEKDSTNGAALHNKAMCLLNQDKLAELKTTIQAAKRHDPEYFENDYIMASLAFLEEDHDKAIELCKTLIQEHPYYYDSYYLLIAIYEAQEDFDKICALMKQLAGIGYSDTDLTTYFSDKCP